MRASNGPSETTGRGTRGEGSRTSFGYYAGCCLNVAYPAQVIASGDDDAYSADCAHYPSVLAAYDGTGRAVFCGDMTALNSNYFGHLRDEERRLIFNTLHWLLRPQAVSVEPTTWARVKSTYR